MGVGDRIRGRYRRLTDLYFHRIAVAEQCELTNGLKVVVSPIHGLHVRVADVIARHVQVTAQRSGVIAAVFVGIEGKRGPSKVEGEELCQIGHHA